MCALGLIMAGVLTAQSAQPIVVGTWRVVETSTVGDAGSVNKAPQPGVYIFTKKYYSFVQVTGDKPRPALPTDLSQASQADLMNVWGAVFNAQSGAYSAKAGRIRLEPMVSKSTSAMAGGFFIEYTVSAEGDTILLTSVLTSNGPIPRPAVVKLARLE